MKTYCKSVWLLSVHLSCSVDEVYVSKSLVVFEATPSFDKVNKSK